MIADLDKWVGLGLVAIGAAASWFNLKGKVDLQDAESRRHKVRIKTLEDREPEKVDLSQVGINTLAIQRLELANERAEEQRANLMRMVEKTQEGIEKQNDKQDKFQTEVIQGITKLSTELQERTKALHS